MISNFHHLDASNKGDMLSSPLVYFDCGGKSETRGLKDLSSDSELDLEHVILGGGGLLDNDYYDQEIARMSQLARGKRIAWGLGYNFHSYPHNFTVSGSAAKRELKGWLQRRGWMPASSWQSKLQNATFEDPSFLQDFDLVGIRDYAIGDRKWTPCASCMLPYIDQYRNSAPSRDVVVFDHPIFMRLDLPEYPRIANIDNSIEDIFAFLSSAETIVTSSYHGLYWGLMLNRRIVCIPWSTKFISLKWPVQYAYDGNGLRHAIKRARSVPEALEEARQANASFAKKASELLEQPISLKDPQAIIDRLP